nr:MAG TPA: hypothetical protein [Caudoviricetes sp.]
MFKYLYFSVNIRNPFKTIYIILGVFIVFIEVVYVSRFWSWSYFLKSYIS